MVPVFGGGDRRNVYNANCNLYLSQEYIPVEMAFGMTVNLFGILKAPLRLGVQNVSPIWQCVAILHNIMIDRNNSCESQKIVPAAPAMVPHNKEVLRETNGYLPQYLDGISVVREVLVRRVKEAGLVWTK